MSSSLDSSLASELASLTMVCCVETGVLEPMTVRMVESLRRHGGRRAQTPVWAITPRFGPPLSRATLCKFAELNVEHRVLRERNPYCWFGMWNKIAALTHVDANTESEYLAFIDSDVLFAGEPDKLVNADFTACVHPTKHLGTSGPDDPNEALWRGLCQTIGLDIDEVPWCETNVDRERIRLYFNSGIFSYRRSTGFGAQWARVCRQILDARVGQTASKNHFTDQIALGLALAQLKLEWRDLPRSHNFDVASWEDNDDTVGLQSARLLHYHDAMNPHFWPQFLGLIEQTQPQLHQWLQALGPVVSPSGRAAQTLAKSLKIKRVVERNRYQAKMVLY